jgi:hypothetical protein
MWDKIKVIMSSVWEFILPFAKQLMSKGGTLLAAAALEAVKTVANNGVGKSGAEKRDMAFNSIVENLKKEGLAVGTDISTSLVNAAIEVALQRVKKI